MISFDIKNSEFVVKLFIQINDNNAAQLKAIYVLVLLLGIEELSLHGKLRIYFMRNL